MRTKTVSYLIAGLLASPAFLGGAEAENEPEKTNDAPERKITAALQYSGITIDPEDNISVDLLLKNRGKTDETVLVEVTEQPADWKVEIKKFSTIISGIFVAAKEDQTLTLTAKPADETLRKLPAGTYRFAIKARSADGALSETSATEVQVLSKERSGERITLETSYPVLRGPSGDKFEFSLDVRNESDEDAAFNFRATAPPGWETSFKPAYEQKQISSLQIKADESKTVTFEVTPPYRAQADTYDFKVEVQSPKAQVEKDLQVVLTGTYTIKAGTPGGLLSVVTQQGKATGLTLYVQNEGSAPQKEISFLSFKPENWKVDFKPEKIEGLEPGGLKQVEMTVTPAEEALVGDYSVAVEVEGEKAKDDLELRVTIKAASAWGWIGVGIIVLVMAGLAVMFKLLGRR